MNHGLTKIRIKCAEIVGWKDIHRRTRNMKREENGVLWVGTLQESLGEREYFVIPAFAESADAALQLVAWMAEPENGSYLWSADNVTNRPIYTVAFISRKKAIQMTADTLPLAVCLAFLKANGINPETL